MVFTKKYRTGQIALATCIATVWMFSNVHGAEVAGPPAQKNLTATPTSAPTPEISVDTEKQNPTDQGTLSKPDHPDQIEDNTAVIILMGVNDLYHVNDYISYINAKAAEWGDRGAQTYFVSVGPVQNDPYCSNAEIESFNAAMQANLSGVTYIDVYSHLVSEGFSTIDGTHYPDSVSVDIYNYILDHLEEQRSGIWG